MSHLLATIVVVALASVTVVGDYFLKLASEQNAALANRWFVCGVASYALSAVGWVFVMRHMKLAEIGVIFSVSTVLLLAAIGYGFFGETLNRYEVLAIALALLSIGMLNRFLS